MEQTTKASGSAVFFVNERQGWAVGSKLINNSIVQGEIFHSEDGGKTWIEQTPESIPRLRDVVFVDSLNGWVVGGEKFRPIAEGGIWHTGNGGETWEAQSIKSGLVLEAVTFLDLNTGWAVGVDTPQGSIILHTDTGGQSWSTQFIGKRGLNDVKFINNQRGWVVSAAGTFLYTIYGGQTWQQQNLGTVTVLTGIDFVDEWTGWIVGWFGTIFHTTTGGVTSVESKTSQALLPESFVLHQNYPNPFNAETRMQFEIIKAKANVKLTIYDVLGREVITLVEGEFTQGRYSVAWNGRDSKGMSLASGVFFYRLQVGSQTQTKKMLLLR